MTHRFVITLIALLSAIQTGCAQPQMSVPADQKVPPFDGKPKQLAINGFNYTDLSIDSFSVGAAGGGNIFVSSPTSGGGGTSCCISLHPGASLPRPITIEWMRNFGGNRRWCTKTVLLSGPIPEDPTALGVHFMPNGDIELEVTHGYPRLRLRLDNHDDGHRRAHGNVIYDEEKAGCRDVH